MDWKEFSAKTKAKFPQYADMDDMDLASKLVAKYPDQYSDVRDSLGDVEPGFLSKAASTFSEGLDMLGNMPVPRGGGMTVNQNIDALRTVATPVTAPIAGLGQLGSRALDAATVGASKLGDTAGPAIGVPLQMAKQLLPVTKDQALMQLITGPLSTEAKGAATAIGGLESASTPAAKSILQIAEQKGLPLTLADVTKSKLWSGLESFLEKTPLGAKPFQEFKNTQIQILREARDELLKKFGPSQEAFQLGDAIKNSVVERSKSFYNASKALYDKVGESAAALGADNNIPLDNLRKKAMQLLEKEKNMAPALQNKSLISELQSLSTEGLPTKIAEKGEAAFGFSRPSYIEKTIPATTNFQYAQNVRSRLGELIAQEDGAFALKSGAGQAGLQGAKFQSTPAGGAYKALRSALNDDVNSWASKVGGEVKNSADMASAFYKEGKQTFDNSIIRSVAKRNPESVADFLLTPNAISEVQAIKKAVSPETFGQIKQSFVEKVLGGMTKGGEYGNEVFLPNNINNALSKYGTPMLNELFSKSEISEISNLGRLASTVGSAERIAGNASGTARQLISATTGGLMLQNPVIGTGVLLTPPIIAKMYLSPIGRRLLIRAFQSSAESKQAVGIAGAITAFLTEQQYRESRKEDPGLKPTPQEVNDSGLGALGRAFRRAGISGI